MLPAVHHLATAHDRQPACRPAYVSPHKVELTGPGGGPIPVALAQQMIARVEVEAEED